MADEYVSQAEFARQVGVSATRIRQLVKAGRIPDNEKKQIPIKAGFAAYDKIRQKAADFKKIYPANTQQDEDAIPMSQESAGKMSVTAAFNKARLAEKTYQAKLKEIEYKLRKGELIENERVREDAHATAAALRGRLVSIPVRIAGVCEGRPAREIEEIIEDAINDALTEFQKSEFMS